MGPLETNTSRFAPSPPLSSYADTSDYGDAILQNKTVSSGQEGEQERQRPETASLANQSGTTSPPASNTRSAASTDSSFASNTDCAGEGDLDTAFSLIVASRQQSVPHDLQSPEWHVLQLSPPQYLELCARLKAHDPDTLSYFENTVRSDYDPGRGVLVLRLMETTIHAYLQTNLTAFLQDELRAIAARTKDDTLSSLISDVRPHGSAKVLFSRGIKHNDRPGTSEPSRREDKQCKLEDRKYPDNQFIFRGTMGPEPGRPYHFTGSRFPQFVLEIGYSQKAKALSRLARDYISKSGGAIKVVLTIDVKYCNAEERGRDSKDQTARFCLYRGPDRLHHNVEFRDASGNPVEGSFQILLSDLVPDDVLNQLSRQLQFQAVSTAINVPLSTMYRFLEESERQQTVVDTWQEPEASPKRVQFHWELDPSSSEGNDDDSGEDSGMRQTRPSRRKRQRTGPTNDPAFCFSGPRGATVPERMRTRSASGIDNDEKDNDDKG